MQSNLILKLSDDREDINQHDVTKSAIDAINEILGDDIIDRVEISWIKDTVDIVMKSGKVLKIKGNSRLDFKFNSLEF